MAQEQIARTNRYTFFGTFDQIYFHYLVRFLLIRDVSSIHLLGIVTVTCSTTQVKPVTKKVW